MQCVVDFFVDVVLEIIILCLFKWLYIDVKSICIYFLVVFRFKKTQTYAKF